LKAGWEEKKKVGKREGSLNLKRLSKGLITKDNEGALS